MDRKGPLWNKYKRISGIQVYTCLRHPSEQNGCYPFGADGCQEDKVNTGYRNS